MKKVFLAVSAAVFLVSAVAYAGIRVQALDDADGVALSSYSLSSGTVVYSEPITVSHNVLYASLLVAEDKSGGAGDVDISAQYSTDKTAWHSAYTSNMSGTITIEGNIVTALQNATRWIVYTPRLAPYMRFKIDPDADSQITVTHILYEE